MKPKVHYQLLEDMQKYIKINPDDYESCNFEHETDPSVIKFVRNYYDTHLPVDATAWIKVNKIDVAFHCGETLVRQVNFVEQILCRFLMPGAMAWYHNPTQVIADDYIRYTKVPVYQIFSKELGIEIILKTISNFCGWTVSVKSEKPLEIDYRNLFDPEREYSATPSDEDLPCVFYENLPEDKLYGTYKQNHAQFTIGLSNDYKLYTLFFLIKNCLE